LLVFQTKPKLNVTNALRRRGREINPIEKGENIFVSAFIAVSSEEEKRV